MRNVRWARLWTIASLGVLSIVSSGTRAQSPGCSNEGNEKTGYRILDKINREVFRSTLFAGTILASAPLRKNSDGTASVFLDDALRLAENYSENAHPATLRVLDCSRMKGITYNDGGFTCHYEVRGDDKILLSLRGRNPIRVGMVEELMIFISSKQLDAKGAHRNQNDLHASPFRLFAEISGCSFSAPFGESFAGPGMLHVEEKKAYPWLSTMVPPAELLDGCRTLFTGAGLGSDDPLTRSVQAIAYSADTLDPDTTSNTEAGVILVMVDLSPLEGRQGGIIWSYPDGRSGYIFQFKSNLLELHSSTEGGKDAALNMWVDYPLLLVKAHCLRIGLTSSLGDNPVVHQLNISSHKKP